MFHEVFDHLLIESISFELEGVSELSQGWTVITIMFCLTDFFGEPPEGFSRLVLKVLMNGSYFQVMAEVPLQQG